MLGALSSSEPLCRWHSLCNASRNARFTGAYSSGGIAVESQLFDKFTRELAKNRHRRSVAKGTAAAAMIGLGLRAGAPAEAARCIEPNDTKKTCSDASDCCGDHVRCNNKGVCKCTGDTSRCDGRCRNFETDDRHCGSCNNACADNEYCKKGKCELIACLGVGQRCGDTTVACCDGLACNAGTGLFKVCGLAGMSA